MARGRVVRRPPSTESAEERREEEEGRRGTTAQATPSLPHPHHFIAMFLRPAQLSRRVIPLTRTISTTPTLLSKASKARVTSPKSKSLLKPKQPTIASNAPTTSASRPAASLFEAVPAASEHVEASHEASGQEDPVKAAVGETEQLRQVEGLRGTGVGASERVYPIGDAVVGREEGAGAVGIGAFDPRA
jgi:hypothetical protein